MLKTLSCYVLKSGIPPPHLKPFFCHEFPGWTFTDNYFSENPESQMLVSANKYGQESIKKVDSDSGKMTFS